MKSTINDPLISTKEFPKLMCYILRKNLVILFSKDKTGTVVSDSSLGEYYSLGYHDNDWNMAFFEDYEGTVTLEN